MPHPTAVRRRGLTLVELLVVLVILVILTTVALQATSGVVDQARYETTQQNLQSIQNALVGPTNQRAPDGSLLITGFVADMGRLPQTVDTVSDPLRELWDVSASTGVGLYGTQTATVPLPGSTGANLQYPPSSIYNSTTTAVPVTISLTCGWRGPYLQLPSGSGGQLVDGWGNPFDSLSQLPDLPSTTPGTGPTYTLTTLNVNNPPLTAGVTVNAVRSRGADNAVDPSPLPASYPPYNLDQYLPTQLTPLPTTLATYSGVANSSGVPTSYGIFGTIPVTVKTFNPTLSATQSDPLAVGSNDSVVIVYFTPVNGVLTPVSSTPVALTSFTGTLTNGSTNITGVSSTSGLSVGQSLTSLQAGFPAPGVITAIGSSTVTLSQAYTGTTTTSAVVISVPTSVSYTFGCQSTTTPVTSGPRAIQAFQYDRTTGNVSRRSAITYLMVPSGGVPNQTLILQ